MTIRYRDGFEIALLSELEEMTEEARLHRAENDCDMSRQLRNAIWRADRARERLEIRLP